MVLGWTPGELITRCLETAASCSRTLITIATSVRQGLWNPCSKKIPREEIYRTTGIQFMQINTLYQLFAAKSKTPELLRSARTLLTIPDLFHFWLTGKAVCEFSNA